jgi:hypothetical protein
MGDKAKGKDKQKKKMSMQTASKIAAAPAANASTAPTKRLTLRSKLAREFKPGEVFVRPDGEHRHRCPSCGIWWTHPDPKCLAQIIAMYPCELQECRDWAARPVNLRRPGRHVKESQAGGLVHYDNGPDNQNDVLEDDYSEESRP